ncbi:hypothetical protein B7G68_02320 [Caulobacter segnis]|uniref:Uncharacterized protein n=2 Tax=Caulobacter segnis TaxID=88688 RepID=D5VED8_CAUST|nr:O-methyltransferase [Caulobacter segnis]ADG08961.1 conserved hypothetical protein [Caulobacter segnis ATCC 21756]AVQ00798.1 hypothetical protein B7G68_02320 [Caulobacter segnis]
MASFDTVNYSLRPNKAIQRQIVFDGLDQIDRVVPLRTSLYIGFGSVWFTDFILAHRRLGITDMISIENKAIGAARARFNAPFKSVKVEEGDSNAVLGNLANNEVLCSKQWIVWLDYDRSLSQEVLNDIVTVMTHASENSILLITINASPGSLGKSPRVREAYIRGLLGDSVSQDYGASNFEAESIVETLSTSLRAYIIDKAVQLGRPGGYVPAFNMSYRDGAPMLTVGGVLPALGARPAIRATVNEPTWPGSPTIPIQAPPLTLKEVGALQRLLPAARPPSRAALRRLGFDLEEEQLAAYCEHYKRYPAFLQVVT